jgi:hypothetical protein
VQAGIQVHNIEHRTLNIERRFFLLWLDVRSWTFNVRRSVFEFCHSNPVSPAKRLCHNKVNVILRSRSDEESLFLIQSINFCITLRSFIPHGGIQDDSFLIATQSRRPEPKFITLNIERRFFYCGSKLEVGRSMFDVQSLNFVIPVPSRLRVRCYSGSVLLRRV